MAQNSLSFLNARGPTGVPAPLSVDGKGALLTEVGGTNAVFNITTATVVLNGTLPVKRIYKLSVIVAGAAGAVYDSASTSGNTAANQIFAIPATVGIYELEWPLANGLVVAPGAAQVVAVTIT